MLKSIRNISDSGPAYLSSFFFCLAVFMPNGIKTSSLVVLLLFLLSGLRFQNWWHGFRKDGFALAACGLFMLTAISWFWTENKEEFFSELRSKLPFLLVPLIINHSNRKLPKTETPLLKALYFSGILISIACLLHAAFLGKNLPLSERMVYEELARFSGIQPIYLSLYVILSSFAWYRLKLKGNLPSGPLHAGAPVFFYLMVVQLSSRTELMVYTGGIILVVLRHYRNHLLKAAAGLTIFAVFTALLISLDKTNSSRYSEMLDFKKDYRQNNWGGRSLRIEKWKNSIECYLQFPMLGTGAGDCSDELQKMYKKNGFDIAFQAQYNPHNQYIQTLLTLGPAGLMCFLALFIITFYRAWKQDNYSLFLLSYIFAASMITESMLERQTGVFLFSVLMAFFASVPQEEKPEEESSDQ